MRRKYHEIRLDREGQEDDIVIQCDQIHLERMDRNLWSLLVYQGDKRVNFNIIAQQSGIMVETLENELEVKVIEHK